MAGTDVYRDTWVWYEPSDLDDHAAKLAQSGCTRALVKAGGDGGNVWSQYSKRLVAAYERRGIRVAPWIFLKNADDIGVLTEALKQAWSDEVLINPEMEWWNRGREEVARMVEGIRRSIRSYHSRVPLLGWSSVPTWGAFPYEAFSEACDGTEQPQVYWRLYRADQVRASNQRARAGAAIVPILPACQTEDSGNDGMTWTDAALRDLFTAINQGLRDQRGFSGWQSGATGPGGLARRDYAHEAMRQAYSSLAEWVMVPQPQRPAPALALPHNVSDNPAAWHCLTPDGQIDAWVVQPEFLAFYQGLGERALELVGLPISGMAPDRHGNLAQWFERARFELQGGRVLLGLVGAEALAYANDAATGRFVPKVRTTIEAIAA